MARAFCARPLRRRCLPSSSKSRDHRPRPDRRRDLHDAADGGSARGAPSGRFAAPRTEARNLPAGAKDPLHHIRRRPWLSGCRLALDAGRQCHSREEVSGFVHRDGHLVGSGATTKCAAATPDRFSKALSSFGVFLCLAFATPLLTITLLEVTEVRMIEVSYGFVAGIVIAAFGRAVALGVFAPDAPRRRLIAVDDLTARSLASYLVCGTRALGVLVLALAVHKALAAPAAMSVATNMLFALVTGALLLH